MYQINFDKPLTVYRYIYFIKSTFVLKKQENKEKNTLKDAFIFYYCTCRYVFGA